MSATQDKPKVDPFWEWVDSPFIRVAATRRHGQWYAVAEDFRIAGGGATEADAYRDLAKLVFAYLRDCQREGMDYWDTMRRIPRRRKLWNVVRSAVARLLRGRSPQPFAEEGRFLLPNFLNGTPYLR